KPHTLSLHDALPISRARRGRPTTRPRRWVSTITSRAATTAGANSTSRTARRRALCRLLLTATLLLIPTLALGQDIAIDFGDDTTLTERAVQIIALITILALAPSILVMVTSFTRIVVVLSLLRTAIGLQTAPPNAVMIALALFLTAFIMTPTLQQSYDVGIAPLIAGEGEIAEGIELASGPLHAFMPANVRDRDVMLFLDLTDSPAPETPEDIELRILIPAFM